MMAGPRRLLGRCPAFFLLAAGFDAMGLSLILLGIFARLELSGRSFGDFLIYGGGILLFFSLLWWLAWYSLNLEVALQELLEDPKDSPKKSNLVHLARKISERLTRRGRGFSRETLVTPNLPGEPLHLTPPVFINLGFNSPQRLCVEEHLEMSTVTQDPLAPCPVTQDPLAPCPVTRDPLAPCPISRNHLAPCRVTESRVAPCRISRNHLAPSRVTENRMAHSRVTKDHLALCPVTMDLLELSQLPALNQHTLDRLV
uniref:Transmembrane protein 238 n=1 Tax=Leptobrachium leishanense TaxID=445787 RepID=A0A8C5QG29_9ANUR